MSKIKLKQNSAKVKMTPNGENFDVEISICDEYWNWFIAKVAIPKKQFKPVNPMLVKMSYEGEE